MLSDGKRNQVQEQLLSSPDSSQFVADRSDFDH